MNPQNILDKPINIEAQIKVLEENKKNALSSKTKAVIDQKTIGISYSNGILNWKEGNGPN